MIKFLSLEPLLSPLPSLDLSGIDWVIVGGESGPGARPMQAAWVVDIRDRCREKKVPFFFKQWGGVRKRAAGRELEGRTWDEVPLILCDQLPATASFSEADIFGSATTCNPGTTKDRFQPQVIENMVSPTGFETEADPTKSTDSDT